MIERLNSKELAFICNQMNIILDSGVAIQDGLEVLQEDTNNKSAKKILASLINGIEDKKALNVVMKESKVFPVYMINMVRIGEMTGKLEEVFGLLSEYYSSEDDMKSAIKSAIFRPVMLLIMLFFVVAVLVIKIIPTFSEIFKQLNIQVSEEFNKSLTLSINMGLGVLIVIAVTIGCLLIGMILVSTNKGKEIFKVIIDKSIFTKVISKKIALSKFCMAMTLMIKSGVDTTEALEYVQDVISSKRIKRKISKCHKSVLDNKGFIESILEENIFTGMQNQMLKVSYKTGSYENTWEKISKTYSKEVDESLENMLQAIEPIMVSIMTIVIGTILVSVMLPLMGIMTSIS